jgi:hypothetical protein
MDDIKRRTLLMWADAERRLSLPDCHYEVLMGWADAMIELQLLREKERETDLWTWIGTD